MRIHIATIANTDDDDDDLFQMILILLMMIRISRRGRVYIKFSSFIPNPKTLPINLLASTVTSINVSKSVSYPITKIPIYTQVVPKVQSQVCSKVCCCSCLQVCAQISIQLLVKVYVQVYAQACIQVLVQENTSCHQQCQTSTRSAQMKTCWHQDKEENQECQEEAYRFQN